MAIEATTVGAVRGYGKARPVSDMYRKVCGGRHGECEPMVSLEA